MQLAVQDLVRMVDLTAVRAEDDEAGVRALAKAAKWLPPGMAYGADAAEERPDAVDAAPNGAVSDAVAAISETEGSEAVVLPEFLTEVGAKAEAASQN